MIKPYQLEQLQKTFPIGSRIELIAMDDPYTKLIPGDQGTVTHIDDIGTVFVAWDKGSSLGLVYGEDRYKKVEG
jgi:hypothetical protein